MVVFHREMFNFTKPELYILSLYFFLIHPCPGYHIRGHIHSDYPARIPNLPGCQETIKPAAGTKVDNRLTGLERSNSLRVTASQSKVGTFRYAIQVLLGITHQGRYLLRTDVRFTTATCLLGSCGFRSATTAGTLDTGSIQIVIFYDILVAQDLG